MRIVSEAAAVIADTVTTPVLLLADDVTPVILPTVRESRASLVVP